MLGKLIGNTRIILRLFFLDIEEFVEFIPLLYFVRILFEFVQVTHAETAWLDPYHGK